MAERLEVLLLSKLDAAHPATHLAFSCCVQLDVCHPNQHPVHSRLYMKEWRTWAVW